MLCYMVEHGFPSGLANPMDDEVSQFRLLVIVNNLSVDALTQMGVLHPDYDHFSSRKSQ